MFRKSALAVAMLGALTTANVVALGLGEIELKSALNQPLDAEVELLSATQEELQELKVEVASPQAFASAGIERTLFLNKLQFDVKTNANGRPVVKISSRDVVREPFLDFLLELSWSKGRLLREYTVLVDPPLTMPAPAPATEAPAARAVTRSAPVAQSGQVTHTAQLPPVSKLPGEYRTQRNDTLWRVAQQLRPDADVSVEQTMLGLLQANPDAFSSNNINNLKAGYILRVPEREELTRISQAEALRETRRQYEQWREQQSAAAPTESTVTAEGAAPQAQSPATSSLQLVAPELSESGAEGGAAGSGDLEALQHDLIIANEALEAQRRQSEEMSSRLAVLEEQIQNMQRLIQLKDDELASLQAQVGEEMGAAELAGGESDSPVAELDSSAQVTAAEMVEAGPVDEAGASIDTLSAEDAGVAQPVPGVDATATDADSVAASSPVGEAAGEDAGAADSVVAAEDAAPSAVDAVSERDAVQPAPVEEAVVAHQPVVPDTATPPGFVDRLLANPLWLGAGAVLLAIAAFLGLRRKRDSDTEFQESILQAAREKSSAAADSEMIRTEPESTHSTTTASSLLSEFAVSDLGSMKHDGEADPLAEADVYLAYGRFQQAEELIKDALQSKPDQEDLNLKLLEVYLAARNPTAFDEHAQEVLGRLENSDAPMWQKIAEMGRELNPENPLYQPGASADAGLGAEDRTLSFEGGIENAASEEFDAQEAGQEASPQHEGLDFGAGLSFDTAEIADELKPDSLEFTPPEPIVDESMLSEADIAEMDSVEPGAVHVEQDNALEFDLEGFDLSGEEEMELPGDGELADLDEVSTKLDLARAYLDMGDPDGARSILGEVIEEGSDDQKSEAQQILAKIA